ncbi:YXWGXW repeat-containing protein [Myxococcota bacterium]
MHQRIDESPGSPRPHDVGPTAGGDSAAIRPLLWCRLPSCKRHVGRLPARCLVAGIVILADACVFGARSQRSLAESRVEPPLLPVPSSAGALLIGVRGQTEPRQAPPEFAAPDDHLWVEGYWHWNGVRYVWVSGRWEPASVSYTRNWTGRRPQDSAASEAAELPQLVEPDGRDGRGVD